MVDLTSLWVTGHSMLCGPLRSLSSLTHIFLVPSAVASHKPTPCPVGTFSSLPEQTTSSTCRSCPSGFYCKEAGLQAPSGWCPAGKRRGEMGSMKRKGQCGSKGQISGTRAPEPSASRRHCQSQQSPVEGGAVLPQ